jgi:hypothetical protein
LNVSPPTSFSGYATDADSGEGSGPSSGPVGAYTLNRAAGRTTVVVVENVAHDVDLNSDGRPPTFHDVDLEIAT